MASIWKNQESSSSLKTITMQHTIPMADDIEVQCSFSFTREQFLEYSRICDFMSKWKKWLAHAIAMIYLICFVLLAA